MKTFNVITNVPSDTDPAGTDVTTTYKIVKVTPTSVFAQKMVGEKGSKGRPSKFAKAAVEAILGETLEVTAEDKVKTVAVAVAPVVAEPVAEAPVGFLASIRNFFGF